MYILIYLWSFIYSFVFFGTSEAIHSAFSCYSALLPSFAYYNSGILALQRGLAAGKEFHKVMKKNSQTLKENMLSSQKIFGGRLLHVYRDTVTLPDGKETTRELIRHPGAACVVPLTETNEVVVVRQFRYPLNEILTEIPAGKLDASGELPEAAAARELREETGFTAKRLTYLGALYPTPAYSDEVIHMYLATGLQHGQQSPDEDEWLSVETIPLCTLVQQILNGEIRDAKTQAAVLKVWCMQNTVSDVPKH